MTVTTGIDAAIIKCHSCPATHPGDDEAAQFEDDWTQCRESDLWTCPTCRDREYAYWERQLGRLARAYGQAKRDGEHDEARAIAFQAGVIDTSED